MNFDVYDCYQATSYCSKPGRCTVEKINLNKLDLIFFEIPDPLSFYALGERSGWAGGGVGYQQMANDSCSGRKLKKSWVT